MTQDLILKNPAAILRRVADAIVRSLPAHDVEHEIRQALEAHPDHPALNHGLGLLLLHRSTPEAALPYLAASSTLAPSEEAYRLAYVDALVRCGDLQKAREVVGQAHKNIGLGDAGSHAWLDRELPSPSERQILTCLINQRLFPAAEDLARKMAARFPRDDFSLVALGMVLRQQGEQGKAEACYRQALLHRPDSADAHFNLGNLLMQRRQPEEAANHFTEALRLRPQAEIHLNLGNAFMALERFAEAEGCFRAALDLKPEFLPAYAQLANALSLQRKHEEAEICYRRALAIAPGAAVFHTNLGCALRALGRHGEAEVAHRQALILQPDLAEARANLGNVLDELGRLPEAEAELRRAVAIRPDFAAPWETLGLLLHKQGLLKEAEEHLRRAAHLCPDNASIADKLASVLMDLGRQSEALAILEHAVATQPHRADVRWSKAMVALQMSPRNRAEAANATAAFAGELAALSTWSAASTGNKAKLEESAGLRQPFFLAYRQGNHRELLSRYGDLVSPAASPPVAGGGRSEKVRLLLVSQHFRRHSVWDILIRGWIEHLDRSRFEIALYHVGTVEDEETERARLLCDLWRDLKSLGNDAACLRAIAEDRPDIILYPEIGMDPLTLRLASRRLAALQVASWGHPITTGLPTIDLFLSADFLEPADADDHYRERLVRLPGTGVCTTPLDVTPVRLPALEAELAISEGPTFLLSQMSFKFDPADDWLYAEIAARVGRCNFVLVSDPKYPWATQRFCDRLRDVFGHRHLDVEDHLFVIPWQERSHFYGLLELADVYLDCPSFSGYTTAWQAVRLGLPVVTLEGAQLRQRLAAGLLRRVGQTATIASTQDQYVEIAARLARRSTDPALRLETRRALRQSAALADHDLSVIPALEEALLAALRVQTPAP